jgi:hypothetical protein
MTISKRTGRRGTCIGALTLVVAALLAGAPCPPADAGEMRLSFIATVGSFGGVNPFDEDGLALGDPFTINFTFDPLKADVLSTPYHAIENTPSGPVDYGYFGDNDLLYASAGSGPLKAGSVSIDIAVGSRVLTLEAIDDARFYASGQPGAQGYLAVEADGVLPGGQAVQITEALFAENVVPLLTATQSAVSNGNPFATAVIFTGDGAVLGTPLSARSKPCRSLPSGR